MTEFFARLVCVTPRQELLRKLMRPRNTVLLETAGALPQQKQKQTNGTATVGGPVRYNLGECPMDTHPEL